MSGPAVPVEWVEDLFGRLAAILGARLADVFAGADTDAVKAEWAQALLGFSGPEIKRGLAATRTHSARGFAPNLPEFLHLCRPSLDPEVAWDEGHLGMKARADAQAFDWSHPAVYWAARDFGHELRVGEPFAKHRKRWEVRLAEWFAAGRWAAIPEVKQRLEAPQPAQGALVPGSRDAALAQLARVRQKLTGYATKAEQDAAEDEAMADDGGAGDRSW